MIDAQTYLEHLKRDGDRITDISVGHLDAPVPSCPGNTIASLLLHTAGVAMFWVDALRRNGPPDPDWTEFPTDALEAHRTLHGRLVDELAARDPEQPTWTWRGPGKVRFAYRRMAQEFAVHRWDFEDATSRSLPIDPTLAADGIDELLMVFGPKNDESNGASQLFAGDGETFRLEANDLPEMWTFTARGDRFDYTDEDPGVTARASASELLLFLWGRTPISALEVSGDTALLERWQERVKI